MHPAGALGQSQRVLAKFKQLCFGAVYAAVSHDTHDDILTEDAVWQAYRSSLEHRGMSSQRVVRLIIPWLG
jgi:hypothetical protein